jgi:hypothetical protein
MKGLGLTAIANEQLEAEQIAKEFIDYLNEFHVKNIQVDNKIKKQLFQDYIDAWENEEAPNFKGTHHFRSSSTGACARQHYMRLKRKKPDPQTVLAQTTRWQNLGTAIGDMIQFDLLMAEKHHTGKFKFERIEKDWGTGKLYPHFEEFSTVTRHFEFLGKQFCIHGSTDGIMEFTRPDGTKLRVGLEIKSKQGSYSKTSLHSMKAPDYKHRKQTVSYSLMFNVDYWIILYVNASKKAWNPTPEDLEKCPDIRAFGHYVTPAMKDEVLGRFASICEAVDNNTPPKLELNNWTFNDYKQACAESLSPQELLELIDYLESEEVIAYPAWLQKSMRSAVEEIAERKGLA